MSTKPAAVGLPEEGRNGEVRHFDFRRDDGSVTSVPLRRIVSRRSNCWEHIDLQGFLAAYKAELIGPTERNETHG